MWKSTTSASGDNHDLESEKQRETNEEASSSAGHGTATVEQRSDAMVTLSIKAKFEVVESRGGIPIQIYSDWKPASDGTTKTCP